MAKKYIIKGQKKGGCTGLLGALLLVCLAIYAFSFALIAAVGVGLWFLMRAWWRSLIVEKPDSRVVVIGMKMTSTGRKVASGVLAAAVVCALCAGVSSCSGTAEDTSAKDAKADTTVTATKDGETSGDTKSDENEKKTVNTMSEQATSKSPTERVNDFVNAFNGISAIPFVQDATFDPSDGDAPYRPHRYTSPVYKGGSGAHGTCGAFSVIAIGSKLGCEVSATQPDYDYQAVADFARAAILAMKPDVDQAALDAALDKFANDDLHTLDFGSIDNDLLQGSATGREFFLRVN